MPQCSRRNYYRGDQLRIGILPLAQTCLMQLTNNKSSFRLTISVSSAQSIENLYGGGIPEIQGASRSDRPPLLSAKLRANGYSTNAKAVSVFSIATLAFLSYSLKVCCGRSKLISVDSSARLGLDRLLRAHNHCRGKDLKARTTDYPVSLVERAGDR
jgi:hypothetical protein